MQYLTITKDMSLSDLSDIVGERNVDTVLNANMLDRAVDIGEEFYDRTIADIPVDPQKKLNILNQFVGDSDLYEKAALGSERDWQALDQFNCFTDAIRVPVEIQLPNSEGILGNGEPVSDRLYGDCTESLKRDGYIDASIFAEYSTSALGSSFGVTTNGSAQNGDLSQWFAIPWGAVVLTSSIGEEFLYFPVYPESIDDGVAANYEEMSEMLYQYEPWKVYKSSGPREISFTFKFHRDMWTGDHRDGLANQLVRGCEANCYPEFDGSLVNVPIVTLYIEGENFISGVMTNCKTHWYGPIGLDGFYLFCELSFTIVEIAQQTLNYTTIRNKGLIG